MTTMLLIRHAEHDLLGKMIAGRMEGVHISTVGQERARSLARRLKDLRITAIYSSPLERALETAEPLSELLGIPIRTSDALLEVDFGEWTGKTFQELSPERRWHDFNSFRSCTSPPSGEYMIEIQARVLAELERLRAEHENELVALFTHGDIVRVMLTHFLGMPVEMLHRIEIAPASVTVVRLARDAVQVLRVNDLGGYYDLDLRE